MRLLNLAMRELEVSNSKLGPRPGACTAEALGTDGVDIPRTELAKGSTPRYPSGVLFDSIPLLDGGGSYEDAEDSVRAYPLLESDMGALRRKTFLVFPDLVTCTVVFPDDMPNPVPRLSSALSDGVASLLGMLGAALFESSTKDVLEGAGSLDEDPPAVAFLLLDKKEEDDCAGILGGFEVLDVIDPFRESPLRVLGAPSSFSGCLARKPKVPLEAILVDGFAPHSNQMNS